MRSSSQDFRKEVTFQVGSSGMSKVRWQRRGRKGIPEEYGFGNQSEQRNSRVEPGEAIQVQTTGAEGAASRGSQERAPDALRSN